MEKVRSYRDLEVYQLARDLAKDIFQITTSFPKAETYSLTDQMRRASRSIGAQIAEAWGKRKYQKHFVSKLSDANGEQLETQHWIDTACDCSYIPNEVAQNLLVRYASVEKMLHAMMKKSSWFCG